VGLDAVRIASIPRVDELQHAEADARRMTEALRIDPRAPPLRETQGAALRALADARPPKGLVGPIGVGHGKTLIAMLAASVVTPRPSRPVWLVPPPLLPQARRDLVQWGRRYRVNPALEVVPYSALSATSGSGLLDEYRPDLLVMDEAHLLRHRSSARTRRVLRYARRNPSTRFVALSGTLTAKSLYEMAHLLELCLRESTPAPLDDNTLRRWDSVVSVDGEPTHADRLSMSSLLRWAGTDDPREAFARRLRSTPGVVASGAGALGTSLLVQLVSTPLPEAIVEALDALEDTWTLPDGRELVSASEKALAARSLRIGFFQRHVWPNGVDTEWLERRSAWASIVSSYLSHGGREGLDSPALLERAAEAGRLQRSTRVTWEAWKAVRDRPGPESVPEWLDDTPLRHALAYTLDTHPRAIVFYQSKGVEDRLEALGFPTYGNGSDTPPPTVDFPCASIFVHGKGKNMQAWSRSVVLEPPTSGHVWEQLIGRTHRPGQAADLVIVDAVNAAHALWKARRDAEYIRGVTKTEQKLLFASYGAVKAGFDARGPS
jgi:hypothetical protein